MILFLALIDTFCTMIENELHLPASSFVRQIVPVADKRVYHNVVNIRDSLNTLHFDRPVVLLVVCYTICTSCFSPFVT